MPDTMNTPPIDTDALDQALRRFPKLMERIQRCWRLGLPPQRPLDDYRQEIPDEYHRILRERAP